MSKTYNHITFKPIGIASISALDLELKPVQIVTDSEPQIRVRRCFNPMYWLVDWVCDSGWIVTHKDLRIETKVLREAWDSKTIKILEKS